jgi:hypothetical protein
MYPVASPSEDLTDDQILGINKYRPAVRTLEAEVEAARVGKAIFGPDEGVAKSAIAKFGLRGFSKARGQVVRTLEQAYRYFLSLDVGSKCEAPSDLKKAAEDWVVSLEVQPVGNPKPASLHTFGPFRGP